ncbi:hypothetical protein Q7P37_002145 [Cladosporium fusiforme]
MAEFIGTTVKVTLKQPPNTILHGVVKEITSDLNLSLEQVVFPKSGQRFAQYTVQGPAIADLEVIGKPDEGAAQPAPAPAPAPAPMLAQGLPPMQMPPQMHPQMPAPPGYHPMPPAHMHTQRPPSAGFGPPPPNMQMHMQRPPSASMYQSPVPMQKPPTAPMPQGPPVPVHQRPPPATYAPSPPVSAQGPSSLPTPGSQIQLPFPTAQNIASPAPPKQAANLVDPAIMSIGRSPAQKRAAAPAPASESPATPIKSAMAKAAEALPAVNTSPYVAEPIKFNLPTRTVAVKEQPSQQLPQAQALPAAVVVGAEDGAEDAASVDPNGKTKRGRRGIRNKNKAGAQTQEVPAVMNVEVSRNGNDMNGSIKRGKGWRQTPLLQPSPQPGATPTKKGSGRLTRRQREEQKEGQNGWATEEATDIQDLGDFDFEASNTLFDKKTVFDELRQGDTTADEDRLVGHNRLARPGTYGGKNLHPTENVLSPKLPTEEVSSDADTEMNFHTGRSSSRHSASKPQASRQNSAIVESRHPLASSVSSDRGLSRSAISIATRNGKPLSTKGNHSPRPDRVQSPHSAVTAKPPASPLPSTSGQGLHLAMEHSGAPCPVLLPAALETLEAETTSRYGLTQDAITETAARSIAELAMSLIDPVEPTSRRGSRSHASRAHAPNTNSTPRVVVVLAGNHAAGARAVAAARHLAPRHSKIILAEAQYESAATQEEQMVKQTLMLKRMARAGADIKRGTWHKASNYIKNLSGPPAIIIDALLAGATYDSLSSPNAAHSEAAQRETREMIDWANRSRAPVLSIACPSGVSGQDGSTTMLDGEPLAVRPDRVLALGAPMIGLLEAMKGGESWEVDLADVGVNIALKIDEAVAFGGLWVDALSFVAE